MQEKTNDPFVPQRIGYLGSWVHNQKLRKKGAKGFLALSKAEEEQVDSLHHVLSL